MKWTGIYLVGFVVLIGGLLAALWKMGVLARIGTTWTLIGVAIAIGIGIISASCSQSPVAAAKKISKSTRNESHRSVRAVRNPTTR